MLDPRPHRRAGLVGGLLTRRERLVAASSPMDMALEAALGEFCLDFLAAVHRCIDRNQWISMRIQTLLPLLQIEKLRLAHFSIPWSPRIPAQEP